MYFIVVYYIEYTYLLYGTTALCFHIIIAIGWSIDKMEYTAFDLTKTFSADRPEWLKCCHIFLGLPGLLLFEMLSRAVCTILLVAILQMWLFYSTLLSITKLPISFVHSTVFLHPHS